MAPPAAAALNAKRYTLAALAVTLAVAAIVTVSSVVLCPARVNFSVARTGFHYYTSGGRTTAGSSLRLNLTLAVENPSRHAAVAYESMFVDVSNSTAAQRESWVRATVAAAMPLRQPGRSVAAVGATVDLVGGDLAAAFTGNMTRGLAVMVTAQARFRVGVAWTRLYDIKVSCGPVSFFPAATAAKPGGGGGAARLPAYCV
ncbi:hypothetical protein GQ55_4G358400 [Panicum hallii var. hallii]|uniref:Late embryogenesis abundant protein LEA-2 subgroup domain-containing protein n=1 Tax=Panicum hallii var. hallii TaxID=1504633 RepID=A0A2T7E3P8_9POAL|nr:hypothetical protein GQ55_4G358400 [Panicum hallii var. hallii]